MSKKKKIIIIFSTVIFLLAILIAWIAWGNKALELNTYFVTSKELPKAFDGFRIAQISDFHNTDFGGDNEKLVEILKQSNPDIIVITGDMIDSRNTRIDIALSLAREAVKIAPCYYAPGNHEARIPEYDELRVGLRALGVNLLEDAKTEIVIGDDKISLIGVNDPTFIAKILKNEESTQIIDKSLKKLIEDTDGFTVLLSHRPELFDVYVTNDIDLAFSGHAHGGQIRLPFIGGIFAPNQDFFPKYDGGLYTQENTNMVVSRGIGNSRFPFRVNNRPEVVLVELASK